MQRFVLFLLVGLTLCRAAVGAAATVEGPKACIKCGMDRTRFAHSRMVVAYADGTSAGVCSIHCAAEEMKESGGKRLGSLMVADYDSKELIAAKSAVWVMGGKKKGVMTSPAKWAFSGDEAARRFIRENGGEIATF